MSRPRRTNRGMNIGRHWRDFRRVTSKRYRRRELARLRASWIYDLNRQWSDAELDDERETVARVVREHRERLANGEH